MRLLGILLFLGVLGAGAWFVVPLLSGGAPAVAPPQRAQVVTADQVKPPPPPTADVVATPADDDGPLCDVAHGEDGPVIAIPAGELIRDGAQGGWTWVSLWAAWCTPCIEEMPLLERFAASQQGAGKRIAPLFLSIDDDRRQLDRFMASKPGQNIRARVVHLPEGAGRTQLYAALGVDDPPALPVQALLDSAGRLRCLRKGAVTERSLAEAAKLIESTR